MYYTMAKDGERKVVNASAHATLSEVTALGWPSENPQADAICVIRTKSLDVANGAMCNTWPLPIPSHVVEEKCELCHGTGHVHDGPPWEDYNPITCGDCDGTGVTRRDYLREAFLIAQGNSITLPERKHVQAILDYSRDVVSAVYVKEAA